MATGSPASTDSTRPELRQALEVLNSINRSLQPSSSGPGSVSPFRAAVVEDDTRFISTPALESLRSRSRRLKLSKERRGLKSSTRAKPPIFTVASKESPKPPIHPNSQTEFHQRLRTYKLSSYPASKPRGLSPPSMAAHGWSNIQKNRLRCDTCGASWVLATPSKGDWSGPSGAQLSELGKKLRIESHQISCPWRNRRCPSSIYRARLWSNGADAAKYLFRTAENLHDFVFHEDQSLFQLEHKLSDSTVSGLSTAVSIVLSTTRNPTTVPVSVRSGCLILALFGWELNSLPENTLSLNPGTTSRSATPQPIVPFSAPPGVTLKSKGIGDRKVFEKMTTISCSLCHRQVLRPKSPRKFNVLSEHRDYCPYVDPLSGFEESFNKNSSHSTAWEDTLELIKKFLERQNGQPSTLEEVIGRFKNVPHSFGPQVGVLSFVKAALDASSEPKKSL